MTIRLSDKAVSAAAVCEVQALHSLPLLDLRAGRQAILEYFENTWSLTELLFSGLASREAYYLRPYHRTRHPLIFYYAHPVCFYINKLLVGGLIDKPVNQAFELLFETGVDEMTWDDLHEGDQDIWPRLEEVITYRAQVYQLVRNIICTHPVMDQPVTMDSPAWGLVMAFEHERIHFETSSVLMRELPLQYVSPPPAWPAFAAALKEPVIRPEAGHHYPSGNPLLEVQAGQVEPGKPRHWPAFGWDNEYGLDQRKVETFRASKFLVSNGEFHQFVADGGYENPAWWGESGWGWRQFRNVKWPSFWVQDGPAGSHRYKLRTIFEVIDMQWDWPAVVNYYEAKAYCAWLSNRNKVDNPYRLLLESEHLAIRDLSQRNARHWIENGGTGRNPDPVMGGGSSASFNHNLAFGSECPVNLMPANSQGFHDVMGNVWQWCEDSFHPLPGFEIHPYYTDFSTPCFDGEHQMILGGSFASTGDEASIWARFHFRPHFFQHAGFRLVQGPDILPRNNKYESTELVDQYLLFHYGSAKDQQDAGISKLVGHPACGNLIAHTVALMDRYAGAHRQALDLGCAVGGASFALAGSFAKVTGLDYSRSFIRTANHLKRFGSLEYKRLETGIFRTALEARIEPHINRKAVQFLQADATRLDLSPLAELEQPFDAVLLSNLLCRLPDPAACLRQFVDNDRYLAAGGILVVSSPNSWMEQFTPREKFFDGEDSEQTLQKLAAELPGFSRIHEEDFPFMIREHRRKYEYIIAQISVWRKS